MVFHLKWLNTKHTPGVSLSLKPTETESPHEVTKLAKKQISRCKDSCKETSIYYFRLTYYYKILVWDNICNHITNLDQHFLKNTKMWNSLGKLFSSSQGEKKKTVTYHRTLRRLVFLDEDNDSYPSALRASGWI